MIKIYLEIGDKRTFASALDWPGWSRSGKDEPSAMQALLEYGGRYARALKEAGIEFTPPEDVTEFEIVERLAGGSGTEFGVPEKIPAYDEQPPGKAELKHLLGILEACWKALDEAERSAQGKALRMGPRGGGRDLDKIVMHVTEAQKAYLSQLGWKLKGDVGEELMGAILEGVEAWARGELPAVGPRGGRRWPARYFIRRSAWHVLDHVWEIEDREEGGR